MVSNCIPPLQCTSLVVFSCMDLEIRGLLCNHEKRSDFEEHAMRSSFITQQDARNIIRRFKKAIKHRNQNDAVSVDRYVCELRKGEDNPVVAYKSQVWQIHDCLFESFHMTL